MFGTKKTEPTKDIFVGVVSLLGYILISNDFCFLAFRPIRLFFLFNREWVQNYGFWMSVF